MSIEKISAAQVGEMLKLASKTLREVSAERNALQEKVAHYEKKERAERLAVAMEDKGLEPGVSLAEKVASLMKRDNLDIVEEAISMSAPQTKTASVHDGGDEVAVEGHHAHEGSAAAFAQNLLSME